MTRVFSAAVSSTAVVLFFAAVVFFAVLVFFAAVSVLAVVVAFLAAAVVFFAAAVVFFAVSVLAAVVAALSNVLGAATVGPEWCVAYPDSGSADVNAALKARELVKGKVLESCELTPREVCDALSEACRAEQVQVIGTKFVLYKRNEKEPKIALVKDKKKA